MKTWMDAHEIVSGFIGIGLGVAIVLVFFALVLAK